jgi:hypothetical protein
MINNELDWPLLSKASLSTRSKDGNIFGSYFLDFLTISTIILSLISGY